MGISRFHKTCRAVLLAGSHAPEKTAVPATAAPPPPVFAAVLHETAALRNEANREAGRVGDRYRSAYWATYLLSSLAVALALLPLGLRRAAGVAVVLEIATITAILAIFIIGSRQRWHLRWLDARTRAEHLRHLPLVALSERIATLGARGPRSSRLSPTADDEAQAAARRATEGIAALSDDGLRGMLQDGSFRRWFAGRLSEQIDYHRRRARDEHLLRHRIHRIALGCFVLTAIAVLAHLVVHSDWLSILAAFLPSFAAALAGIAAHSESERLEVDSLKMVDRLEALSRDIDALGADPEATVQVVDRCLDALLSELEDWNAYARQKVLTLA